MAHAKSCCQSLRWRCRRPNKAYVFFPQLGTSMGAAAALSALCDHVAPVVLVASCEQVRRITARWVIASVQNILIAGYWAIRAFVGHAMRSKLAAIVVPDDAIAVAVFGAMPRPARVWFTRHEVVHESLGQRALASTVAARFRAERMSLTADRSEVALAAERMPHARRANASAACVDGYVGWVTVSLAAMLGLFVHLCIVALMDAVK